MRLEPDVMIVDDKAFLSIVESDQTSIIIPQTHGLEKALVKLLTRKNGDEAITVTVVQSINRIPWMVSTDKRDKTVSMFASLLGIPEEFFR